MTGNVTLGDILEILPFEDPIVVIELDGAAIWDALEAALSTFPAQEGRFPIISGFRAVWDSRRPPGQRVLGVWLTKEPSGSTTNTPLHSGSATPASLSVSNLLQTIGGGSESAPLLTDVEEIKREKGSKKYVIVTREYMAEGHDGFIPLKGSKYLVDDESGQMMSTIVRKYLLGELSQVVVYELVHQPRLGCRFVNRMANLVNAHYDLLHSETAQVINREKGRQARYEKSQSQAHQEAASKWRRIANAALRWSRAHYKDNLYVSEREHMSPVDCFDGEGLRAALKSENWDNKEDTSARITQEDMEKDLVTIHPIVDGRLRDEGRQ